MNKRLDKMERIVCKHCGKKFRSEDSLHQHKQARHQEELKGIFHLSSEGKIKIKRTGVYLGVLVLIAYGVYLGIVNIKTYPPTSPQGHVESYPPYRIMNEPIPEPIQKHILEHVSSASGNRPGVLVQYNCEKFKCEQGLIDKLESIVKKYDYVYLAPYPQMDAKIALTKAGKLEILDKFNEERIIRFIGG